MARDLAPGRCRALCWHDVGDIGVNPEPGGRHARKTNQGWRRSAPLRPKHRHRRAWSISIRPGPSFGLFRGRLKLLFADLPVNTAFVDSAMTQLQQWTFTPARPDGKGIPAVIVEELHFSCPSQPGTGRVTRWPCDWRLAPRALTCSQRVSVVLDAQSAPRRGSSASRSWVRAHQRPGR